MARTQRVEKLIKNFMQYHEEGYSIPEIAEIFDIDFSTVYKHLQEIAEKNGTTREALLAKQNSGGFSRTTFYKETVDVKELKAGFRKVDEDITNLIDTINDIIKE